MVGAGPNGLAAAIKLATHDIDVTLVESRSSTGGGLRSSRPFRSGSLVDDCSGFHPLAMASPFFTSLEQRGIGLATVGVEFAHPAVVVGHPLDDGDGGILLRSVVETAERLGPDATTWRRVFEPLADNVDAMLNLALRPLTAAHPKDFVAARAFVIRAAMPANAISLLFRTSRARALLSGISAHTLSPLWWPLSAAGGLLLATVGQTYGWPVVVGGSGSIARGLSRIATELGVTIITDQRIDRLADVEKLAGVDTGRGDLVFLDTSPRAALGIVDGRQRRADAAAYRRFRHGPGAFKVDFDLRGDIPWTNPELASAGTVHLGGTWREVSGAEISVWRGCVSEQPYVLLGQQYVADPQRLGRVGGDLTRPVWTYAHVPHGSSKDALPALLRQVERFAPGFQDLIVDMRVRTPADLEDGNANYVGGDIGGGANDALQLIRRPKAFSPYATGVAGVFLCSASTPPGGGVHGMGGYNAVDAALREGRREGGVRRLCGPTRAPYRC